MGIALISGAKTRWNGNLNVWISVMNPLIDEEENKLIAFSDITSAYTVEKRDFNGKKQK